jgi:hypothetical protein
VRTDRVNVCAVCWLRYSYANCPQCNAASGSARPDRRDARASRPAPTTATRWYRLWSGVAAFVIAAVIYGALARHGRWPPYQLFALIFAASWVAAWLGLTAITTALEVRRDAMPLPRMATALAIARDPEIDPTVKREMVRGRVRVSQPVPAPLSRVACAAFRLVGDSARGAIDDAGATAFDVVADDGTVTRIDAPPAAVVLEQLGRRVTIRPHAKLAEFLRARGLDDGSGAKVEIAEALLRSGDEVEVSGTCVDEPRATGYRDTAPARVMRELPGSPLTIRGPARRPA